MTYRTITRRNKEWLWPEYDTELIKVFDQVDDIDIILKHCPNKRVAIQAGGACGVWPQRLAQEFERVYTFEPDPVNFHALVTNLTNARAFNAVACNAALDAEDGECQIARDPGENTNCGAGYIKAGTDIPSMALDNHFGMDNVDLVCLDVEGREHEALTGMAALIWTSWPTVVIEEKDLPHKPCGDARALLESWDYSEVGRVHRDVIFTRG